jgi:hypothetical protein
MSEAVLTTLYRGRADSLDRALDELLAERDASGTEQDRGEAIWRVEILLRECAGLSGDLESSWDAIALRHFERGVELGTAGGLLALFLFVSRRAAQIAERLLEIVNLASEATRPGIRGVAELLQAKERLAALAARLERLHAFVTGPAPPVNGALAAESLAALERGEGIDVGDLLKGLGTDAP